MGHEYIEIDPETIEQMHADDHAAFNAAREWDEYINSAECQNSPAYAAGYAKAVADRKALDAVATDNQIKRCQTVPARGLHFSAMLNHRENF